MSTLRLCKGHLVLATLNMAGITASFYFESIVASEIAGGATTQSYRFPIEKK
jgi:hypothetical protein